MVGTRLSISLWERTKSTLVGAFFRSNLAARRIFNNNRWVYLIPDLGFARTPPPPHYLPLAASHNYLCSKRIRVTNYLCVSAISVVSSSFFFFTEYWKKVGSSKRNQPRAPFSHPSRLLQTWQSWLSPCSATCSQQPRPLVITNRMFQFTTGNKCCWRLVKKHVACFVILR